MGMNKVDQLKQFSCLSLLILSYFLKKLYFSFLVICSHTAQFLFSDMFFKFIFGATIEDKINVGLHRNKRESQNA